MPDEKRRHRYVSKGLLHRDARRRIDRRGRWLGGYLPLGHRPGDPGYRGNHSWGQPVMERFGVPATTRASLAFYNTRKEIDALVRGLEKVAEMFH